MCFAPNIPAAPAVPYGYPDP